MKFFDMKKGLYPILAVFSAIFIIVFGLTQAKKINCSYFLAGVLVLLILFGMGKATVKMLAGYLVFGGIFMTIAYFSSGQNAMAALAMANRLGVIFLAVVPGMSVEPVRMTRNLSSLKFPRSVTLGMLIVMSFVPVLKGEIKRVGEAMRTRGAGSILNPKIFYRALLIPLATRLVDISDTLSLSIETRGFTLGKERCSVYKSETLGIIDILYFLCLVAWAILTAVVL